MGTILVVDDEPAVCRSLVTLLRGAGHAAYAVYAGPDALELLRTVRVDVVVLDALMPGVDGLAVLAAIRGDPRTAGQKVLLYSATADLRGTAADAVVSKAASPARLLAEVASLAISGGGDVGRGDN